MRISSVNNYNKSFPKFTPKKQEKKSDVSFKAIYVGALVELGNASKNSFPASFLAKDALLLNEIAQLYPNQDCFIKCGYANRPMLEYRERPPEVQVFYENKYNEYTMDVSSNDKDYPCIPLILDKETLFNGVIGVPSFISTNPSLPYTIKAGFELHKKMIERKFQIMDIIGRTDEVDFGPESVMQKAKIAIEETEVAVTRLLLEAAYLALTDKASARQIYESNYPKIQSRMDFRRKTDLTTSVSKQEDFSPSQTTQIDLCEIAVEKYPDHEKNKTRIQTLFDYMSNNGITLDDSENLVK